jgi:tRNA (mo5U34)-methyltransferase
VEVTSAREDLARDVSERMWYHTLELAPGLETPGWFDLRPALRTIPFPASLAGKRCLDVGTFDGFWAFEMERRGASEVIAIDLLEPQSWDWPSASDPQIIDQIARRKGTGEELGVGFEIARRALDSKVERLEMSAYDLDPDRVGRFDFVYLGSLLLHLRDPVRALEAVRSVCAGTFLLCDAIDTTLTLLHPRAPLASLDGTGRPWWWKPNAAGLQRMVEAAGFAVLERPTRVRMAPGAGHARPRVRELLQSLPSRSARAASMHALRGDPHVAILAQPAA